MASPSSLPQVLQNLTWLDFDPQKNCTWAGKLFAQLHSDNGAEELSLYYLAEFAYACAPIPLRGRVTIGDLINFNNVNAAKSNASLMDLSTKAQIYNKTLSSCHQAFCQNAKWEGNPDLSGIGVLVAYSLQCVVTTVLFLICIIMEIRSLCSKEKPSGTNPNDVEWLENPSTSWIKSVRACVEAFWLWSFYFDVGMVIAGVAVSVIDDFSNHTMTFAFLGAALSTTVLGCLHHWYRPEHRRIANTCLSGVGFLLVLMIILQVRSIKGSEQTAFEQHCFSDLPTQKVMFTFAVVVLVALGGAILGFMWLVAGWSMRERSRVWYVFQSMLTIACFITMWTSIAFIFRLRVEISHVAGNSYAENKWGFGQLLAVLAWIPLVVEFLKIWWDVVKATLVAIISKLERWFDPRPRRALDGQVEMTPRPA